MTEKINSFPQVLTLAGTDSGGGAGIMADLKTMQSRHVFGMAVVVAVTAQNTLGVQNSLMIPQEMIDAQCSSVAADFDIKACKTGMLGDAQHVHYVAQNLQKYDFGPLVVDPVMVAKGGATLLEDEALQTVKDELLPLATIVTPNLVEAQRIVGHEINDRAEVRAAAKDIQRLGVKNVIIKGGHMQSDTQEASDYFLFADQTDLWLSAPRINTDRTHGTGDTLSACLAAELAKGVDIKQAVRTAKVYVQAAIENTIQVGHGHGPLNHWAYEEAKNAEI
ncbi:MAG TPA: bifunctional hydroxymethylpyrimidine kinase/phosphomethylpyrimidine kinase [Ligilactobacillus acidipiscis]|uniref:Hydroxymethylpyrimidine/phosphomethylpyrimidine kinase n=1 Tax=Ligilactobacillus acidipiscis TaxID=89059 RepID=A0A921FCA7_9LACO|nr:bifunctional hydroxymethylpyrimidine kinase/phosphomethylpyrimidine kinase [Ligilactobacillus acidipiscis]